MFSYSVYPLLLITCARVLMKGSSSTTPYLLLIAITQVLIKDSSSVPYLE